jgi:hypothetical protein
VRGWMAVHPRTPKFKARTKVLSRYKRTVSRSETGEGESRKSNTNSGPASSLELPRKSGEAERDFHLSGPFFELDGTEVSERGMAPGWVVEAVDIACNGSASSVRKAEAARANGKLGVRPRKTAG